MKIAVTEDINELKAGVYEAFEEGDYYLVKVEEENGYRMFMVNKLHPALNTSMEEEEDRDVGGSSSGL